MSFAKKFNPSILTVLLMLSILKTLAFSNVSEVNGITVIHVTILKHGTFNVYFFEMLEQ